MAANPAQERYPVIPGVSKAVQDELTTLRRMIYQQQQDAAASASVAAPAVVKPVVKPASALLSPTGVVIVPATGVGQAYTDIPLVPILPSTNPTTGQPYANDGTVVDFNDIFYRYNRALLSWSQAGKAVSLTGTHAERGPATDYPAGTLFYETDTEVLFIVEPHGAVLTWVNVLGPLLLNGTHADRLAAFPSVQYAFETQYFETDRTATYWIQNATGFVTITGGVNVAWVSGDHFINSGSGFNAAQWPAGTVITIAGVDCVVSVVGSDIALTLAAPTTNAVNVSYTVAAGRWVYLQGEYLAALASLPVDLGENDVSVDSGFLFFENAVYFHQLAWTGSAWQRGPHDLEHSDTFHEFGAAPTDGGWATCDGSTATYLKYDGSTASRVLPDLTTAAYAKSTKATYSPTLVAPVLPTVTTTVPGGSAPSTSTGTAVTSVAGVGIVVTTGTFVTAVTGGGGGGGTNIPGTVLLPGDPVENFSVIKVYRK